MKVKLKLIFKTGIFLVGNFYIPKKDLNELGLFGAVKKKVSHFSPVKTLILQ